MEKPHQTQAIIQLNYIFICFKTFKTLVITFCARRGTIWITWYMKYLQCPLIRHRFISFNCNKYDHACTMPSYLSTLQHNYGALCWRINVWTAGICARSGLTQQTAQTNHGDAANWWNSACVSETLRDLPVISETTTHSVEQHGWAGRAAAGLWEYGTYM